MKAEKKARAIIRKMKAKKDDKNETDFSGVDSDSLKGENNPKKDAQLEEDEDPSVYSNASFYGPIFLNIEN